MALQTTAEQPVPVRTIARMIGEWVSRLGRVWVEGQVAQLTRRPGAATAFLTLRDPVADVSVTVTCPGRVLDAVRPPLVEGARVVVHGKPEFYLTRGTLSLVAAEIRSVGLGALLARLEQVRATLAAEGLFAPERKRPLPFLPRRIGLVCGRGSAAERDVLENTRRRWPGVDITVANVAVQGVYAVTEVSEALRRLDRDTTVDVIVVARGGGSVEDLLPFSDEGLLRVVSACVTPIVSAIGHEQDTPLIDLVADVRASTPTDAARLVVPDVQEELTGVAAARRRTSAAVTRLVEREQHRLDQLRARPALTRPQVLIERHEGVLVDLRARAARALRHDLERGADAIGHLRARVTALSPAATLERGYAVVQLLDGTVVRDPGQAILGSPLRVRVAGGSFEAARTPGPSS